MSSTFRRNKDSKLIQTKNDTTATPQLRAAQLRGTKPWTNGQTLTSFGLREIDSMIFGGGQALGTSTVIEEDRLVGLGEVLARYWCAEAIAQNQELGICITKSSSCAPLPRNISTSNSYEKTMQGCSMDKAREFLRSLPRNLNLDKLQNKQQQEPASISTQTILEEEGEKEEEGLEIAWQYSKSIQKERGNRMEKKREQQMDNVFCHSYDLSRSMIDQFDSAAYRNVLPHVHMLRCTAEDGCPQNGLKLAKMILHHMQRMRHHYPNSVLRFLLLYPPPTPIATALPMIQSYIRTHSLPVLLLLITQPWTITSPHHSLHTTADAVFTLHSFHNRPTHIPHPPEFRDLDALLSVSKLNTLWNQDYYADMHRFANTLIAHRFGLKQDRRKLQLKMLHLPPEDMAGGGGSTAGVRTGAGRPSCATSLEF